MEELIRQYKRELSERIALKKTLNKTNEQIILDNFKYFDLSSSNYCNVNDFEGLNCCEKSFTNTKGIEIHYFLYNCNNYLQLNQNI